jgi:signal transduction histidine kinase
MGAVLRDDHRPRAAGPAAVLGALVVAEVAVAVTGSVLAGSSLADARDSFVLTNSVIALSYALAGALIGWQRPRNPVGWLLLAGGVLQGATAAAVPYLSVGLPDPGQRTLATVAAYAWPWSIALCLPLALLLFPDGRLPSPRWRPVLAVPAVGGALFVLGYGSDPAGFSGDGRDVPWLVLPDHAALAPLWGAAEALNLAAYLAALVGLVVRYRRGDEQRRRQLLWLVLALFATLAVLVVWVPAAGRSGQLVLALLVIPLVPVAITIAVLRHRLLDIRLVLSRTVLYALLTAGVAAAYVGLVAGADLLLRREAGLGGSVLATVLIAVGFNPVRVRLQGLVDRALYGDRADPVRAVSRLGERLGSGGGPGAAVAVVRQALRLPWVALRVGGVDQASDGTDPGQHEEVPLVYDGDRLGELVVGVRPGERGLARADRAVLELLAVPLATAVRATALSASLQESRAGIVAAREEERRRLRRDLHDGLGPVLTGVAFQADAAGNLLRSDPDRAAALLAGMRERTAEAIADVRRLVHELRPPALDELGLVGALRRHAEDLDGRVLLDVPAPLPDLPAAVEVTAYRIALEAVTNAVRHSGATRVELHVAAGEALHVRVTDDGPGRGAWRPGVGLASMRERVAEVGGTVAAGPGPRGGLVEARLPLGAG